MKTNVIKFLFIISCSIMMTTSSCTNKEEKSLEESTKGLNAVKMTPYKIAIDSIKKNVEVSFVQSAIIFNFKLDKSNTKENIKILENAKAKDIPVNIYITKNTYEIVKVEKVTTIEQKSYRNLITASERSIVEQSSARAFNIIPNQTELNRLFNIIKRQSCGTTTAPNVCITFRFPVDGCYARAHKMRQILLQNGYESYKQFVYGNLAATTGTCCVRWGYHVAPLVYVSINGVIQERIIDPSLFPNGAVTPVAWRNACIVTTCNAMARTTSFINLHGSYYYYNPATNSGIADNNYVNTNCVLSRFKNYYGCAFQAPSVANCGY